MTVHYVNGFTDSPIADCCGATLALLDAGEITMNLDAVTCGRRGTIYDEIRAERERAHAKHGATSMEMAPVDEMYRAVILGEEIGEVAELAWSAALTAKFSHVQKSMNDGRHDGAVDLVKLREELVQVATMAAAWADRIPAEPPATIPGARGSEDAMWADIAAAGGTS